MTPHLHRELVPGCYRCELSEDEVSRTALVDPVEVIRQLGAASLALSLAHKAAAEREPGTDWDLIGPVRDAIFGITTTVDALSQMVQEGRFDGTRRAAP